MKLTQNEMREIWKRQKNEIAALKAEVEYWRRRCIKEAKLREGVRINGRSPQTRISRSYGAESTLP